MLETITYSTGTRIASFAGGKTGQIISNAALANEKLLASAASTIDVAAHQIVMQTWWLLSYMSSPLALIGQALIPRDLAAGRGNKVRYVIMLLSRFGLAIGTICALLCAVFSYALPNTFTDNIVIQAAVQKVTIPVAISQFLICIATTFDGISIGSNAMSDYVWAGIVSTGSAWLFYFFSMQYKLGLMGAWIGLSIFSFTRLLYNIHRFPVVMQSTYKKPSGGSPASDSDYSPLMSHAWTCTRCN
jgi:Na+-driven multidrug efflux pump